MNEDDKELIEWIEFVATKFADDRAGWVYSRDLGDLDYIRYKSDYTGYNHWTKRWKRALPFAWSGNFSRNKRSPLFSPGKRGLWDRTRGFFIYAYIQIRKDKNLPDGQINGIITHWEETGEYLSAFQPRVGVKVLDFLKAEPDNIYARAILDEMHTVTEMSFPKEGADET